MLIFVVNIRPARTFWNSTHCLLSRFMLDWSRNLWHNPTWNMAVNNISYPIYPLSMRTQKGYITKMIPFFFCSVYYTWQVKIDSPGIPCSAFNIDTHVMRLLPLFMIGFHRTFCDGCFMPTGDAYLSGHLVLSHFGLAYIYVLLVQTNLFPEFVIFPDYAIRTSLGTFSILPSASVFIIYRTLCCKIQCLERIT